MSNICKRKGGYIFKKYGIIYAIPLNKGDKQMKTNEVKKKINVLNKATENKRKNMRIQIANAKIANQNFKELEYDVYSTIK